MTEAEYFVVYDLAGHRQIGWIDDSQLDETCEYWVSRTVAGHRVTEWVLAADCDETCEYFAAYDLAGHRTYAMTPQAPGTLDPGAGEPLTSGTIEDNGIWTWFTDPRAVVRDGTLYVGHLSGGGDVQVSALDLATAALTSFTLSVSLQQDDHDNPAIHVRPDGRLICFYSKHSADNNLRFRISTNPGDITAWGAEQASAITNVAGASGFSYSNPHYLSAQGRLFLFARGAQLFPVVTYSDNDGASWQACKSLFEPLVGARPYMKYVSNGVDRIDFWGTTGHPREVTAGDCDIYHFYYSAATQAFHKSDGTQTKTLATVMAGTPLDANDVTIVHDATAESGGGNGNGWTWSIEYDAAGHPVVTYAVYVANDDNRYRYARWDGSQWVKSGDMVTGVSSLYGPGATSEPQYTGGIVIDPRNTARVYLCRQVSGSWELERWITDDGGQNWTSEAITSASGATKNCRPYCPRNWKSGAPAVLWCAALSYTSYTNYRSAVKASPAPTVAPPDPPPPGAVTDTFTGTASTALSDHTTDSDHEWDQHPVYYAQSACLTAAGRARPSASTASARYRSNWEPATADYSVQAAVVAVSATGSAGVCGRLDPATDSCYFFRRNSSGGVWQLFKFVNGTSTQLGSSVGGAGVAKLEMIGTAIKGYVDGVEIISVTDAAVSAKGYAGVQLAGGGSDATGHQLDNFSVLDL